METRAQSASENAGSGSCGARTRSKRTLTERDQPLSKAPRRPRGSSSKPSHQAADTMSERTGSLGGHRSAACPASAMCGSSSAGSSEAGSSSQRECRRQQLEEAEQEAMEMMEENASRGAGQSWSAPSSALQGLLRKLGAGLDDLLPSVTASHGRLKTILVGLKSEDDGLILASLSELCELLSIGTEESLSTLSVDVFVPLLVQLLRREHNADIMLLASRALCHMIDAIPSSSAAIVHYDGVPLFCERLLSIEYIDLAEQALHALEKLSHEHPVALLRAGGMLAVLQYVDFFAMGVQRLAVSTAANLCRSLPVECAHLVADAVPLLSGLLNHHDQKVLENACLAFARLAEAFSNVPEQLDMLAAHSLLPSLLRLVSSMTSGCSAFGDSRVTLSDSTHTMLLRTLATLCRGSATLCKQLLELDVCTVLHDILVSSDDSATGAAASRPHDQLFQLLSLASELLPPLPKSEHDRAAAAAAATCAVASSSSGGRSLATKRRSKRNDLEAAGERSRDDVVPGQPVSERERALLDSPELLEGYGKKLFPLLLVVHSSAISSSVRQKCLLCITKVLHLYPAPALEELLREQALAAFIAPLISAQEPPAALSALKMAEILLTKLPHVYEDKFLREGVFNAVAALSSGDDDSVGAVGVSPADKSCDAPSVPAVAAGGAAAGTLNSCAASPSSAPFSARRTSRRQSDPVGATPAAAAPSPGACPSHPSPAAGCSAFAGQDARRIGKLRRSPAASRAALAGESDVAPSPLTPFAREPSGFRTSVGQEAETAVVAQAARFDSIFLSSKPALAAIVAAGEGSSTLKKLRSLAAHMSDPTLYSTLNPSVPIAGSLEAFADVDALRQLASLLEQHEGISTFELANSGLAEALLRYLVAEGSDANDRVDRRKVRMRALCYVFLGKEPPALPPAATGQGIPAPPTAVEGAGSRAHDSTPLQMLVAKLQDALNMVERFPLVLSDTPSSDSGSSGLKALTQPFKLRLQRSAGSAGMLKEYANNVVLIEPLATAAAIEDFLWPKVRRDATLRQGARDSGHRMAESSASCSQSAAPSTQDLPPSDAMTAQGVPDRAPGSVSGKQPALNDQSKSGGRSSGKEHSSGDMDAGGVPDKQREVGVFLSGFEDCGDGEVDDDDADGEDMDEEDDEEDEDDDGSMLSSPALTSALDSAECVHDLQLNSPEPRCGGAPSRGPSATFQLPSSAGTAASSTRRYGGRNGASPSAEAGAACQAGQPKPTAFASATAAAASGAAPTTAASASTSAPPSQGAPAAEGRRHYLTLLLNNHPLPYSMTIFQAIRQFGGASGVQRDASSEDAPLPAPGSLGHRLWGDVYTITYRLATSKDAPESDTADGRVDLVAAASPSAVDSAVGDRQVRVSAHDADPLLCRLGQQLPTVMPPEDASSTVLQLLWLLNALREHWPSLFDAKELARMSTDGGPVFPSTVLLNRKLNAKLMRQLQDPLALCSRSLPAWCAALTSNCPFLFNFESRRLFLHSTAFGLSRALQRLQQHSQEGASNANSSERSEFRLGRLPRQKVRISRSRVMDSAFKVMELYASHKALLEVEYFGEVGTGLGPTLEFYTLVSLELRRSELNLWLAESPLPTADDDPNEKTYVHAPYGLFPKPMPQRPNGTGVPSRTLQLFTFMGRFVAKAMLDNRLVDLPFSNVFYRYLLGFELGMADLVSLAPQMSKSLRQLQELAMKHTALVRAGAPASQVAQLTLHGSQVSDLGLDFTLPGYENVELVPNGAEREVTLENLSEYVQLVLQTMLLDGVRAQMDAFQRGFSEVFAVERLRAFSPDELDLLFNGMRERWDRDVVVEQLKFDHGYTRTSQAVSFLLDILGELSEPELRQFLKFVTGSPRLPVGGLARLSPRLTIVQKRPETGVSPDAYLPSVMTCANYLKLPDYSSKSVMKQRLMTAINEGQGCFLLS